MNASVRTRSFRLGDRFWEISWTGLFAEIESGVVGKRGRAREHSFASASELDAFVAARIASTTKKGFAECDPASLAGPDVTDPFQKRVEDVARRLRRDALVPETEPGDGPPDASRFGGLPWLLAGEDTVDCGRCHAPMPLVLQLRRDDVPAPWQRLFAADLIQFFLCDSACQGDDGWEPFARSSLVRHVPLCAPGPTGRPGRGLPALPGKLVRGWARRDDHPSYEDLLREVPDADVLAISAALKTRGDTPLEGEKLGGWPHWIQSASYPRCTCGALMQPFFQVDSHHTLPIQLGDTGVGWMVHCSSCQAMTFLWQSC